MIDLRDKVVLVTGGPGGTGAAIVRAVVSAGGYAVLHDIRDGGPAAAVQRAIGPDRCQAIVGDFTEDAAPARIFAEALAWRRRIDVLVNNVGLYEPASLVGSFDAWSAAWHRALQVNLIALAHLCREAITHFQTRGGGGAIVNLVNPTDLIGKDVDHLPHAAATGGVMAMTRTIARQCGADNVTAVTQTPDAFRAEIEAAAAPAPRRIAAREKEMPALLAPAAHVY